MLLYSIVIQIIQICFRGPVMLLVTCFLIFLLVSAVIVKCWICFQHDLFSFYRFLILFELGYFLYFFLHVNIWIFYNITYEYFWLLIRSFIKRFGFILYIANGYVYTSEVTFKDFKRSFKKNVKTALPLCDACKSSVIKSKRNSTERCYCQTSNGKTFKG